MMAGYSVKGTLAHHVLSEPKEITTSTGDRVPVNLSIHYISFSAHSDYAQVIASECFGFPSILSVCF